jgi:hypothetical protein
MKTILLTIVFGCALQAQTGETRSWDRQAAATVTAPG